MSCRLFIILFSLCLHSFGLEKIRLWADTDVRAKSVTLTPYLAPASLPSAPSVIVCPGGSYSWLDMKTEGVKVARWLQENGISAFVLKYRVQGYVQFFTHSRFLFPGHQHPDMIADLQRAIQYVREHASEYGINPHRLGVMGFSAGGHLAMYSAEQGAGNKESLRPDFVAAIYPVVSMSHPVSHKRSRRALLGERRKNDQAMRDSLSLEKHVPRDCPPVFLMNCMDDPVVNYRNSELLDSALTAQGINHRYIQYRTGGHGFGVSKFRLCLSGAKKKCSPECRAWKDEFLKWLEGYGK